MEQKYFFIMEKNDFENFFIDEKIFFSMIFLSSSIIIIHRIFFDQSSKNDVRKKMISHFLEDFLKRAGGQELGVERSGVAGWWARWRGGGVNLSCWHHRTVYKTTSRLDQEQSFCKRCWTVFCVCYRIVQKVPAMLLL